MNLFEILLLLKHLYWKLCSLFNPGAAEKSISASCSLRKIFKIFFYKLFNSQAPDVPELAHRGIFRLSRLSVNSYLQTVKKYYP